MSIRQLHAKQRIGQTFNNLTFNLYISLMRHIHVKNDGNISRFSSGFPTITHIVPQSEALVNTIVSSGSIASECSKTAAQERSFIAKVQPSSFSYTTAPPPRA